MDAHQFVRVLIREANRPDQTLPFGEIARQGLLRYRPALYELLTVHYTNADVTDASVRDWILEKWSDRDDQP